MGFSEAADKSRHAFITEGSQLVDLNTLAGQFDRGRVCSLDEAYGVNARGWVVGDGTTVDGKGAAFVAVPKSSGSVNVRSPPEPKAGQLRCVLHPTLVEGGRVVEAGAYGYVFRPKIATDSGDLATLPRRALVKHRQRLVLGIQ